MENSQNKLSTVTKLAFGVGDVGPAIVTAIQGFYLSYFLLNVAALPPWAVGTIMLIAKIWDGVNDPFVGALTDRTNTRWGRRRPWLLFGAIPFGLSYFLLWLVPHWSDLAKFWYYLIVVIILDTAYTAVNVPYAALTPELTKDYDERTSLNSYRFSFSILGGVMALFLHGIILDAFKGTQGYVISAGVWAFFLTVPNFITFAFTKESQFSQDEEKGPGFFEGLKIAFTNRAFIWVTLIYLFSWLALQFVQNNLLLYIKLWIGAEDSTFRYLALILQVTAFVFLLIWARVSERIGKQNVYYIGMSCWVLVSVGLFFVQPGQVALLYGLAALAAIGTSVAYLIPWSMLPDVIEADELETGQRREGLYYSFFVFLQKLGVAAGLSLSTYVLGWAGYISPAFEGGPIPPQPAGVTMVLRIFVSFVPAVLLLLSFIAVRAYPITRAKHDEMMAELDRRRAEKAAKA